MRLPICALRRTCPPLFIFLTFRWRTFGGDYAGNKILSDWLHNLPVGWMAVVFFGCAYLSAALIYAMVIEFPTSMWVRGRAFSASMLSPLGTLFALFVAFTAAQVWNDNDRATGSVAQEASALRAVEQRQRGIAVVAGLRLVAVCSMPSSRRHCTGLSSTMRIAIVPRT